MLFTRLTLPFASRALAFVSSPPSVAKGTLFKAFGCELSSWLQLGLHHRNRYSLRGPISLLGARRISFLWFVSFLFDK